MEDQDPTQSFFVSESLRDSHGNDITPSVCRLCLSDSKFKKSMFHCSFGEKTYAEIYETCTGFVVEDGLDLPTNLCNECEGKMISFHIFRTNIVNVEKRIQQYQSQFETKIDIDEVEEEFLQNEEELNEEYNDDTITYEEEEIFQDNTHQSQDFYVISDETIHYAVEDDSEINEAEEVRDKTVCKFVLSDSYMKAVKCLVCTEICEHEQKINSSKADFNFPITCECDGVFKNRRSFLKHFISIHQRKISSFKCRNCDESFTSWRGRVAHEASTHNVGLKFECSTCQKKFYRSDHWKEHSSYCTSRTKEESKFFSCGVCLYTFQREDTYKKHLETAHIGADDSNNEYVKKAEEYAQRYSKSRKSEVSFDNQSTSESSGKQTADGPTCNICQKNFKNELSLSKHTSLFHTNQYWSCDKCDAVFVHRSTKISHMSKEHGDKKPFECSFTGCDFSCFKKDRFIAHVEKHKNPDKKFPCPICLQEFLSYNTMTLHRAKHLNKNAFVCLTCNKQFLDKRNFNVHLKLHTGEDLFHCPVCSRGFNRKDHLQKHQKRKSHYESSETQ